MDLLEEKKRKLRELQLQNKEAKELELIDKQIAEQQAELKKRRMERTKLGGFVKEVGKFGKSFKKWNEKNKTRLLEDD
jgi:hypothetical protein